MTHLHYLETDRHLSAQMRREFPQVLAGMVWGLLLGALPIASAWLHSVVSRGL